MQDSQIKVTLNDFMGTDLTAVNAARVSFGKESKWANQSDYDENQYGPDSSVKGILSERDTNLIHYLASGMSSKDIERWKEQMVSSNDPDTVMEAYNILQAAEPHMSPFGHCFTSFHVKAPIFVARQLV